MSVSNTEQALVVLNVPPSQEEAVVDWLLARGGSGFTSQPVFGHSSDHDNLSPAEQVSGRRRRLQFQIQMPSASVDTFLREGRERFGTADAHYSVSPLIACGPLETFESMER